MNAKLLLHVNYINKEFYKCYDIQGTHSMAQHFVYLPSCFYMNIFIIINTNDKGLPFLYYFIEFKKYI